jgi:general secretion pathway protein G
VGRLLLETQSGFNYIPVSDREESMMNNAKIRRYAAGFTLIEILVVVMILGILATIVVVKTSGYGDQSRIATTRATIKNIRTAINAFEMAVGRWPENLNELVIEGDDNWPGPFLDAEQVPKDGWGREFKYEIVGKRVKVTSAAKDGQFGTADDLWE